jgi:hypothetical protein
MYQGVYIHFEAPPVQEEVPPEPGPPAEEVKEATAEKAPVDVEKKEDIPTAEAKPVEKGPE